jgi:hypothetical protein
MSVTLKVILSARAAEKMSDFLTILFSHEVASAAIAVETDDVGVHAEASAATDVSAGCYRQPEHVIVLPFVVGSP